MSVAVLLLHPRSSACPWPFPQLAAANAGEAAMPTTAAVSASTTTTLARVARAFMDDPPICARQVPSGRHATTGTRTQ